MCICCVDYGHILQRTTNLKIICNTCEHNMKMGPGPDLNPESGALVGPVRYMAQAHFHCEVYGMERAH